VSGTGNLILAGTNAVSATAPITVTGSTANLTVNNAQTLASISSSGNATFTVGTSIVGQGNGIGTGANGTSTTGGIDGTGTFNVATGVNLTAAHIRQATLNINGTATVTIADSTLPAPTHGTINVVGNTAATSVVNDLNFSSDVNGNPTGTLDLKNNDMIVNDTYPTVFTAIQNAINNAADGGNWDKPGITSSSAAAANANAGSQVYGLGYATGAEIAAAGGSGTSFDNQTITAGSTVIKYTLVGDSTLKGSVGGLDYDTVLNNFGTPQDWAGGNFHYGTGPVGSLVGGLDYDAVLNNFGASAQGNLVAGPSLAKTRGVASPSVRAASPSLSANPALSSPNDLILNVNTVTGDVSIYANNATALTQYTIIDENGGNLDSPASPQLLSVAAGSGGNQQTFAQGVYVNWYAVANTQYELDEAQANNGYKVTHNGTTSYTPSKYDTINIPAGGSIDFGDIYGGGSAAANEDLIFQFYEANSASPYSPTSGYNDQAGTVAYSDGSSPTPEPGTLGILGLGGVMMMRRRRRQSATGATKA
jgi:hypothetical protein